MERDDEEGDNLMVCEIQEKGRQKFNNELV